MPEQKLTRREVAVLATAAAAGLVATPAAAAPQPHMVAALKLLNDALAELRLAATDKGGFRAKAIQHLQVAIGDVNDGITYANSH